VGAGAAQAKRAKLRGALRRSEDLLAEAAPDVEAMRSAVHQFGIVEGEYDSKDMRLQQLLERLPAEKGAAVIFAEPSSQAAVAATMDRCRRRAVAAAAKQKAGRTKAVASMAQGEDVSEALLREWTCTCCTRSNGGLADACIACGARRGAFPRVTVVVLKHEASARAAQFAGVSCQLIINYDPPRSGQEYVRRLTALHESEAQALAPPRVAYTFMEESELKSRVVREVAALLRSTRPHVAAGKAAELDSALEVLNLLDEDEEDDEEWGSDDDGGQCDCAHCRGSILASTSFHPLLPAPGEHLSTSSGVEVVRLPLRALEDFDTAVPFIAPRHPGHSCTLICLHCLNVHTPWDGWEQYFAPCDFRGSMRVVLVLADNVSWHDYPDSALLCTGGSSWVDILDMESMDRSDLLLERLVDHEAALLNGHSERIVLMGMSQGGGQSMLRFLRSKLRLGGWVGSVCHVPTAPHTPRSCDPLTVEGRPTINRDRPIRLLAGESDCVFPPGLVLRDAARLRNVGGFTNVEVEVRTQMCHVGMMEEPKSAKSPEKPILRKAGSKNLSPEKSERVKKASSGRSGGAAARKAIDEATLHRMKSIARAMKSVPDLLYLQRHLPSLVDMAASGSGPEAV